MIVPDKGERPVVVNKNLGSEAIYSATLLLEGAISEVFRARAILSGEGRYSPSLSEAGDELVPLLNKLRLLNGQEAIDERRAIFGEAPENYSKQEAIQR